MAVLQKIGYKQTGYSEPFIVPTGQSVTAALLSGQNWGVTGVNGAVPIEYTEYRNAGLFVTANATTSAVTMTADVCNFHNSGYGGKWVLTDDDGTTYFTVDGIVYEDGVYTLTLSGSFDAVQGTSYRVVARQLDLGSATATKTYSAGERVVLPVVAVGTYSADAPTT